MIEVANLLEEIQLLKSSMEDLHAEHLTELKVVQSSQKEIVYVMKQLSASDREKKLMLNLKRSVELDYDLHVRDNIKAWTAEYCKSCRSIRSIMSQYEGQDNPVLATEIEEKRLLRHLNKITKRAERTAEEDEIIRRGYFKVIHRVLDSLSTMDHRDEMDRLHLKRTVQYICTRLVDFWNSGVPVIKSFYRDGEVRLISSQAVFQDMWTSIRNQRYLRENRERALAAGCSIVGRKTITSSTITPKLKSIQTMAKRTIHRTVERAPKRYSYSASSTPNSSTQSSVHTTPSSSANSPAGDSMDSYESYATSGGSSPAAGRSFSTARRYGIQTRSVTSATSSPVSSHSCPSTPGSVLPRKSLYSANDYASELDEASDSDDDMLFGEAESDGEKCIDNADEDPIVQMSKPETPHQVRWDWKVDSSASSTSNDSSSDALSAEEKVDAIFKKHLGDARKKFSRAELDNCITPASAGGRMVLSGSSISCDWEEGDDADLGVESDAEYEREHQDGAKSEEEQSDNESDVEVDISSETDSRAESDVADETPVKKSILSSPSASLESTSARKVQLRWAPLDGDISTEESGAPQSTRRERSLSSLVAVTPHQFLVQSGAAVKVSASPVGRAHLGPELCSSAEQTSSTSDAVMRTPTQSRSEPLNVALETAQSDSSPTVNMTEESPGSVVSSVSLKKDRSHKRKKSRPSSEGEVVSQVDASSPPAVSAHKNLLTPVSSPLAVSTSFQSPPVPVAHSSSNWTVQSSHPAASFQSPCADDASQMSSVCTSATTPSNGLVYLDLQAAKADRKARKRERRERRALKAIKKEGSAEKAANKNSLIREHSDSVSVTSAVSSGHSGDAPLRDRSALTAILGSYHTPSPLTQQ